MKKYTSKIGAGIVLFIAIALGGSSTFMIINEAWPGIIINLFVAGLLSYVFMTTYYVIDNHDLIIKCGFFINMKISIDTIIKIKETHNPISSPAASLDRIAIYYNDKQSVMISPKDKMDFINHLLQINEKIEVVLKKDQRK